MELQFLEVKKIMLYSESKEKKNCQKKEDALWDLCVWYVAALPKILEMLQPWTIWRTMRLKCISSSLRLKWIKESPFKVGLLQHHLEEKYQQENDEF